MRTDTDRLDWLARRDACVERFLVFMGDFHWRVCIENDVIAEGESPREAIDAAMDLDSPLPALLQPADG